MSVSGNCAGVRGGSSQLTSRVKPVANNDSRVMRQVSSFTNGIRLRSFMIGISIGSSSKSCYGFDIFIHVGEDVVVGFDGVVCGSCGLGVSDGCIAGVSVLVEEGVGSGCAVGVVGILGDW